MTRGGAAAQKHALLVGPPTSSVMIIQAAVLRSCHKARFTDRSWAEKAHGLWRFDRCRSMINWRNINFTGVRSLLTSCEYNARFYVHNVGNPGGIFGMLYSRASRALRSLGRRLCASTVALTLVASATFVGVSVAQAAPADATRYPAGSTKTPVIAACSPTPSTSMKLASINGHAPAGHATISAGATLIYSLHVAPTCSPADTGDPDNSSTGRHVLCRARRELVAGQRVGVTNGDER